MATLTLAKVAELAPGSDIRELTVLEASGKDFEKLDDLRWGFFLRSGCRGSQVQSVCGAEAS